MSPEALPTLRAVLACRAMFRAADAYRAIATAPPLPSPPGGSLADAREVLRLAEVAAREALAALPDDAALEGLAGHLAVSGALPAFPDPKALKGRR